jgi:subtilisin family serine protease
MKRHCAFLVALCIWLAASAASAAPQEYLLRVSKSSALDRVLKTHGLRVVRTVSWIGLHIVTGPQGVSADALEAQVRADRNVKSFEREHVFTSGETAAAHPDLKQTTAVLEQALSVDRTAIDFYGAPAWTGYVRQGALDVLDLDATHAAGTKGQGVLVAVIDSGLDERHPLLKDAIVEGGYDFTRGVWGASEWSDLDQSTAFILDNHRCDPVLVQGETVQSTAFILDAGCGPAILQQSTAFILDGDTLTALGTTPPLPSAFGHGTMVAGLIHRVAPEAKILPLKAFAADGTGRSSDIAQAIYYAVYMGAKVINMSFTLPVVSQEVLWATSFAASQRVVLVGSAGNKGLEMRAWPAEHKHVVGVGSTTIDDRRAAFSNQGYDTVKVVAPGVDLVTTFPGGRYAAVSGTSFSAALVSGTAALMANAAPLLEWGATRDVCYQAPLDDAFGFVRDSSNRYPQRIRVPTAAEYAVIFQRDQTKQLNYIK